MSKQETKFEFCTHEQHGGVCKLTGEYCCLGPCPKEDIEEFVPVRHGRWSGGDYDKCSVCGGLELGRTNYCPNCGARMDGAE